MGWGLGQGNGKHWRARAWGHLSVRRTGRPSGRLVGVGSAWVGGVSAGAPACIAGFSLPLAFRGLRLAASLPGSAKVNLGHWRDPARDGRLFPQDPPNWLLDEGVGILTADGLGWGSWFSVSNFQTAFEKEYVALLTNVHSQTTASSSPVPLLPGVPCPGLAFQIFGGLKRNSKSNPSSPQTRQFLTVFCKFVVT